MIKFDGLLDGWPLSWVSYSHWRFNLFYDSPIYRPIRLGQFKTQVEILSNFDGQIQICSKWKSPMEVSVTV